MKGGRLHVERRGEGVPVLVVPGAGADHLALLSQIRALEEAGYQVVAVDPRGTGASWRSEDGYDFPTFVADVLAVHDRLGLPRAHLLGHSLGSVVSLGAALEAPDRFLSVAALAPWAYTDPPMGHFLRMLAEVVANFPPERYGPWLLTFLASRHYLQDEARMASVVRSMFLGPRALPGAWLARHLLVGASLDLRGRLGSLARPVLVLYGREDRMIPPSYSEEVVELLPNAVAVALEGPGAGHLLHFERPREVARRVVDFFRAVEAGKA